MLGQLLTKFGEHIQFLTKNPNPRSKNAKFYSQEGKYRKSVNFKNVLRYVFRMFSLLALKFGIFRPQIRIPSDKLYIWPPANVRSPTSGQNP